MTGTSQDEWRDISTAPKDGTAILAYWSPVVEGAADAMDIALWADGGWRDPDDIEALYGTPTHWMPLPPAPSTSGGGA